MPLQAADHARLAKMAKQPPIVFVHDNFMSEDECQHIVDLAEPHLRRATVCGDVQGLQSSGRTGSNCWIKHGASAVTMALVERISKLLKVPASHAESLQVIYYDKSQQYRPHYDGWLHDGSAKTTRTLTKGGQRIWTALCYLNTVPKGGSTRFTKLGIDVAAIKGRLLIFSNTIHGTNVRHPLAEHAGTPVLEGSKTAFNLWFRERPATVRRDPEPTMQLGFEMVKLPPPQAPKRATNEQNGTSSGGGDPSLGSAGSQVQQGGSEEPSPATRPAQKENPDEQSVFAPGNAVAP